MLVETIPHQILKHVWLLKRKKPINYKVNISLSVDIRRKANGRIEFEGACISLEVVEWHLLVECDGLGMHIATPRAALRVNR